MIADDVNGPYLHESAFLLRLKPPEAGWPPVNISHGSDQPPQINMHLDSETFLLAN